ncbi:MAG TPA: hypothetical protein VFH72_12645 [Candidatus Baltobacteraceae bacterium]|jgi:hypothetical protein|nr:hypothetical protein [Candidatus Baltobacteraceae bacterium]
MSIYRSAAATAAALLLSCGAVLAQVESTPVPQTPKPNFSQMAFLTGTWNCSVKSSRRPSAYQTTSTANVSSDGYWMVTRTTTHKASWIPAELRSEDRRTYDPSTSRWIDIGTDDGGGYNVSTSPGWKGNTITWTDAVITKVNATASTNPTVMTKVSNSKTTSRSSFKEPSGRLINVVTTCTKRP